MCISGVVDLTSVVAWWQQQAGNSSSIHSGCSHFLLSIDSCFTVWDSQLRPLRLMTQGKNWAYITVFLTENRGVEKEYFPKSCAYQQNLSELESTCVPFSVMLPACKACKLSLCVSRSPGEWKKKMILPGKWSFLDLLEVLNQKWKV